MIKRVVFCCLVLFVFISCSKENSVPIESSQELFIKGADMSFLPLIEGEGTKYYNANNQIEDALITLKNAGCNTIRIRLWKNSPQNLSTINEVKLLAQRVRSAGMKVWLCVHYSDTWADPSAQTIPAEWASLSYSDFKVAFINYTSTVVNQIKPDIIQIGNEINNGFMWPRADLSSNETDFLALLSAASNTIRSQSPNTKILLHYAGIGNDASLFFNKVAAIDYDYIGLSYYPIWHGKNLEEVKSIINTLGQAYNKKVIIAETAYPFTLNFEDLTANVLGSNDQIIPLYSATPLGQKAYLLALKSKIKETQMGFGFCYWGTEWVAFRGTQSTNGSPWENQSLWDFNNKVLPAIAVFSE
ncbi:glycosyl hydrolase 53 family protein [Flavobacterium sp.]|uniref:glycoside hydrolase family 53 protein n=1 Tax=Flavobacterium sp. TaxID=239 RepID=UPI0025CEE660|nr:glycosyl hydrolase 53 family protein [Flavobacterium sp.]